MCEANAYLKKANSEELFMEQVDIIEHTAAGLRLVDIFGRQKTVNAKIKDLNLLNHRIILEEVAEAN